MPKRIGLVMFLCLCVFAQRAATQQVPVGILLDNVRTLANKVVNYDGDTHVSAAFADEIFTNAKQASLAVDKAIAAGVPQTQKITLNSGNSDKPMTLAEIKGMCASVAKVAAFSNADQAIENASIWPAYIADGTINQEAQGKNAFDTAKFCVAKVNEALANGVPDSTQTRNQKMSLAEGRELCIYVRDTAQGIVNKQTAAEEAQYEPFRQILSGDKLGLYNNRLKKYKLYGAGGKVLKTPEDYHNSPLWCTTGVDRDGIVPVWSVECWHFKGMTKEGAVTTRTGDGDEAPSSAFR